MPTHHKPPPRLHPAPISPKTPSRTHSRFPRSTRPHAHPPTHATPPSSTAAIHPHSSLGFLFFYEMMTDSLRLRVLTDDKPFLLASILLRMLPANDLNTPSELMSILRITAMNPQLAPGMPKYEDKRKARPGGEGSCVLFCALRR